MDALSDASRLENGRSLSYVLDSLSGIRDLGTNFLSMPAVRESAKLFLLGLAIESSRRTLVLAYTQCVDSFFITAEFDERDETFSKWTMSKISETAYLFCFLM